MSKKSTRIALGGLFSALCLTLMFLTGVVPFSTFYMPLIAGVMLIAVVVENGTKTAVLVYVTVSLLSILVVPDKESVLVFVVFFGYYPIAKGKLERLRPRLLEYLCKYLLFNISIVSGYLVVAHLFGMTELLEGMGTFGQYTQWVMLGMGNIAFALYDFLLTRYIALYIRWFKPTFLKR